MIVIQPLVCGAYAENAYLVFDENRPDLLVIDPGDDLPALEKAVRQSGKRLADILLTHGHFDHTLAAAPLREKYGARVHVHPLDAHMLSLPGAAVMNAAVSRLPFAPIRPDAPFPAEERFELTLCGMTFEGLHTPGHTPGGVSLILPAAQAVFTGDTLFAFGCGRCDLPGGNPAALAASLRALLALPGTLTAYAGHGGADTMAAIAARWTVN